MVEGCHVAPSIQAQLRPGEHCTSSEQDPLFPAPPGGESTSLSSCWDSPWDTLTFPSFGVKEPPFLFKTSIARESLTTGASTMSGDFFQLYSDFPECLAARVLRFSLVSFVHHPEELPVSAVKGRTRAKGP